MERNDEMSDMKKIVLADASEEFRRMLAELVAEVQNRVAYSAAILDTDYYRLALEHAGMITDGKT